MARSEAYEAGKDLGWKHAAYVDAYGGDKDSGPESVPGYIHQDQESEYRDGWEQGVEDFEEDDSEDSEDPWPYADDPRER
jgi:hypothetical protein